MKATWADAPVAIPASAAPHQGTPAIEPASAAAAVAIAAASTAGRTYTRSRGSAPVTDPRAAITNGSPGRSAFVWSACASPSTAGSASSPSRATTAERQTCWGVSLPTGAFPVPSIA